MSWIEHEGCDEHDAGTMCAGCVTSSNVGYRIVMLTRQRDELLKLLKQATAELSALGYRGMANKFRTRIQEAEADGR